MERKSQPPASKADLAAVKSELKGDLAAVKSELKADLAAVKSELKGDLAAVKSELKGDLAAVKSELKGDIARLDVKTDRIAAELVKTQGRMKAIEETMATKDDIGRVIKAIDAFAGKLETYGRETILIPNALDEHGKTLRSHGSKLDDHERRLAEVEKT
ncbi:MAG: hypothetical protein HYZ75_00630 [Elusimicrobia bacterium]|nr:hypothetical protein [Elusimicrobiota bacterium]